MYCKQRCRIDSHRSGIPSILCAETRTTRFQKMTKEGNSDIVVASTAISEETAKNPSKTNNDEIAASTADETEIFTTDKPTLQLGGNVEGGKDADKTRISNEEVQTKADEASVVKDSTVVHGREGIFKTDASLAEATGNSAITGNTGSTTAAAGDVELTANFPQKV